MTTLKAAVIGDVGDTRIVQLAGIDNLAGVTAIEAHVWRGTPIVKATLVAEVLDAAECTITVELGATDEGWLTTGATPGTWSIEYQLTFGAAGPLTWPAEADKLPVRAQGD